jgi:hypothetical protein
MSSFFEDLNDLVAETPAGRVLAVTWQSCLCPVQLLWVCLLDNSQAFISLHNVWVQLLLYVAFLIWV